jgi:N-acetylglucosaminyl-diphospho-decaprenol L-rhamnosyltransferase
MIKKSLIKLDIIIVNWNTGLQLSECLKSIAICEATFFTIQRIVVVDNASSDRSLELTVDLNFPVQIIHNTINKGFAAACNEGALHSTADYVLFLNPDTRLFKDSIFVPLIFMEQPENSQIGICGIQLIDENGKESLSYERFPSLEKFIIQSLGMNKFLRRSWTQDSNRTLTGSSFLTVDQIIGAFFIVRRSIFEQLNGFDENFFVYFEEVDFSLRAYNKGWLSACLTDVKCTHIGCGTSRHVKAERLFYSLRSRILYGFKHFSIFQAFLLLIITLIVEFMSRILYSFVRGAWQELRHTIRGYSMLINDMPIIIKRAFKINKSYKQDCL